MYVIFIRRQTDVGLGVFTQLGTWKTTFFLGYRSKNHLGNLLHFIFTLQYIAFSEREFEWIRHHLQAPDVFPHATNDKSYKLLMSEEVRKLIKILNFSKPKLKGWTEIKMFGTNFEI